MIMISSCSGNEEVQMTQTSSTSQLTSQINPAYLRKEDIHIYDEIPHSTTSNLHSPTPEYLQIIHQSGEEESP